MLLLLLSVELGHWAFVCLVRRIVALSTRLGVRKVPADFLQSLCILHLLVAHRGLCRRVHAVEVQDLLVSCGQSSHNIVIQVA